MKICYITTQIPFGIGEAFILEEMLEAKHQGVDLLIIPRNPDKNIFHKKAKELLESAIWLPIVNSKMIIIFLKALLTNTFFWRILGSIVLHSRNPRIFIKNLIVLPKGVFVAKIIQKEKVEHIHAHWGSTTSTMAYIVFRITGIPWSFTLHRWDIKENNILEEKVKSAKFTRCISEHGKNELFGIIGKECEDKIKVIHMGVNIPENIPEWQRVKELFTIIVPANLLEVKGHKYIVEACSMLVKEGARNFQCIFYGDGPFRTKLKNLIEERALTNYMKIPGVIPHEKLIEIYKNKKIDIVVLPSIITNKGEHEGIPVALMEAIAYKISVISTNTGGISELLSGGAGVIVEEKNSRKLADAIKKLMENSNLKRNLGESGREKIQNEFNVHKNVQALLKLTMGEKELN